MAIEDITAVRCRSAFAIKPPLAWLVIAVLCAGAPTEAASGIGLTLVASGVPYIADIQHAGGDGRLFLVSQPGRIFILDGSQVLLSPFLDLSAIVRFGGEQGLLGMAFHPNYAANGYFFVHYQDLSGNSVVARYRVTSDPNVADAGSGVIVLTVTQPFANHNGGQLGFGPDGYLYIALGDGGSGGDPLGNGQNLNTLLGKVLRLNVDAGSPYAIPADNPFVNTPGARGEIWATGLRNPWRFSFDRQTGDLFIADVGESQWEEVNMQPAGGAGGRNYGWRLMEGRHCYNPSSGCNDGTLVQPILEYSHTVGCSITGGFRYRGTALTGYAGTYLFGDWCSGAISGATPDANGTWRVTRLLDTPYNITTLGEDAAGEIYIAHHGDGGELYRLATTVVSPFRLSISTRGTGKGRVTSTPVLLDCGDVCAADLATDTLVTLVATADGGSAFAGWTGDPDCVDAAVTLAADRACTAAFGAGFTDNVLVVGVTPVKAVHITELRSRIDALRVAAGLAAVAWSDSALAPESITVRAVHIAELRSALGQVYSSRGQTAPTYTDVGPGAVTAVRAVHVTELRSAVLALESSGPNAAV